jgi:hypothetical protein
VFLKNYFRIFLIAVKKLLKKPILELWLIKFFILLKNVIFMCIYPKNMMKETKQRSTKFWIISVSALIWNLIGVFVYLGQSFMNDEILKTLSQSEQNYFLSIPAWVTAAFATAVFAGFSGSICLLLRKKIAYLLYLISFLALIVQHLYNLFIQDFLSFSGTQLILPVFTTIIGASLLWYAKKMDEKGVLN